MVKTTTTLWPQDGNTGISFHLENSQIFFIYDRQLKQTTTVLRLFGAQVLYSQHFIFFLTYEWENNLPCYITLPQKGFPV